MSHKLPVFLVSGYLGSGKTTFIAQLINQFNSPRLAIIENEVGNSGVDALLLKSDAQVFEIIDGCVCCSVQNDFREALDQIIHSKNLFNALILEASGIADPASIINTFCLEQYKQYFEIYNVIVIIDLAYFIKNELENIDLRRQIIMADTFIFNKVDLVTPPQKDKIIEMISLYNPQAKNFVATNGKIIDAQFTFENFHQQLAIQTNAFSLLALNNHAVDVLNFQFQGFISEKDFLDWLEYFLSIHNQVYRFKAIIYFDQYQKYIVQAVGRNTQVIFLAYVTSEIPQNKLVLIGEQLSKMQINSDIDYLIQNFVQ